VYLSLNAAIEERIQYSALEWGRLLKGAEYFCCLSSTNTIPTKRMLTIYRRILIKWFRFRVNYENPFGNDADVRVCLLLYYVHGHMCM
jgi:hypothetical protein